MILVELTLKIRLAIIFFESMRSNEAVERATYRKSTMNLSELKKSGWQKESFVTKST
jgi:hypothetical protein